LRLSGMVNVSFVILTRNSSRTIGKVLSSLRAVREWLGDVVVVDGGSVDETLEVVRGFSDVLPVKILSDNGRGLGYARDLGWRATDSPYVVMLDSDVVLDPRFVSEAVRLMETDRGLGGVAAKLKPVVTEHGWLAAFQGYNLAIYLHLREPCYPREAVALHTGCTMFRRAALEEFGGFDHFFRLAKEDSDISFRLRKAGYRLSYIPIEVMHLERARFWSTNFRYGRSYVHIAEKHPDFSPLWTPKNVLLTAALLLPPLQTLIYLHYLRRYMSLKQLSRGVGAVMAGVETLRQAVRTAGMLYELFKKLVRSREVSG
jgi:GT2 family glycosyltransferase